MISSNRKWFKNEPASSEALQALRQAVKAELPSEYFDLLAFSNGGEGPLAIPPWNFCLDSAEQATKYVLLKNFFEGFFVFGGDGGGELIAFDMRGAKPWPIVSIDAANADLDEGAEVIAENFFAFLVAVGVEKIP